LLAVASTRTVLRWLLRSAVDWSGRSGPGVIATAIQHDTQNGDAALKQLVPGAGNLFAACRPGPHTQDRPVSEVGEQDCVGDRENGRAVEDDVVKSSDDRDQESLHGLGLEKARGVGGERPGRKDGNVGKLGGKDCLQRIRMRRQNRHEPDAVGHVQDLVDVRAA
jgi:hypothetical protein